MKKLIVFISILFCFFFLVKPINADVDYTLFSRHPFSPEEILPDTGPAAGDEVPVNTLTMFAARGEYESTSFAIYNSGSQLLQSVEVSLPELTKGPDSIGPEDIEVRVIKIIDKRIDRYDLSKGLAPKPDVLVPYTADWIAEGDFDVPVQESRRWWITVRVDQNISPGLYRGQITVNSANEDPQTIDVELEVSPARLLPSSSGKGVGFWYHPPDAANGGPWNINDPSTLGTFRQIIRADFELMAKMGLTTVTVHVLFGQGNTLFLDAFFDEAKSAGLGDLPIVYMTGGSHGASFLNERKSIAEANGIPELYWMTADEAFQDWPDEQTPSQQEKREFFRNAANGIHDVLPDAKVMMTIGFTHWLNPYRTGWSEVEDEYGNLWSSYMNVQGYNVSIESYGMNRPNPIAPIEDELASTGDVGWMYTNRAKSMLNYRPYNHRIDSGVFLRFVTPVQVNLPWAYQWIAGSAWDDSDTDGRTSKGDMVYAYPNPYNNFDPLPAMRFVGMREGIDDRRFFDTLELAIEESNDAAKKDEAQNFLQGVDDTLMSVVPCRDYGQTLINAVSPTQFDNWRKRTAQLIVKLGQPKPLLKEIIQAYGGSSPDLNNDGFVNGLDFASLL